MNTSKQLSSPGQLIVYYGADTASLCFVSDASRILEKDRLVRMSRKPEDVAFLKALANASELVKTLDLAKTIIEGAVHPSCRRPNDGLSKIEAMLAKVAP